MRKRSGFRLPTLLLIMVLILSLWNPMIFATESVDGELNETPLEEELVDQGESPADTPLDQGENQDPEGNSEEGSEDGLEQEPQDDQQEEANEEQDPSKDKKAVAQENSKDEPEDQKPMEQEAPGMDQEEELEPKYFSSNLPNKIGPIITSLNAPLLKSGVRMFGLNAQDDYVDPVEGLNLTKTATPVEGSEDAHGRQIFRLDLTATTESEVIITTKPSDIILVLDRSGSMDDSLGYKYTPITESPRDGVTYYVKVNGQYLSLTKSILNSNTWYHGSILDPKYVRWDPNGDDNGAGGNSNNPTDKPFYTRSSQTKLSALKEAANNFVQTVYSKSPQSRVAVVSFNTSSTDHTDGLVAISSGGGVNSTITNAINGLSATGGTYPHTGLSTANDIFQGDTSTDRNRVVIMFTDGEPGQQGNIGSNNGKQYAARAINQAAALKAARGSNVNSNVSFDGQTSGAVNNGTGKGATVYTIGIFPSNVNTLTHRYMTWVSSEKPYNGNYGTPPANTSPNKENGYYFTADSADALERIFQEIAEETGQTIEDVVTKDYIDPRFDIVGASGNKLPLGSTITVGGGETGTIRQDANGIYVEWEVEKIEPGELEDGKGFKASLYIKAKDDFIGGNNIPTNILGISAIYSGGDNIGSFPDPLVNVPFKLTMKDIQDTIFLGEGIPRSKSQAQGDMVEEDLVSYNYPSGMLTYTWDPSFTDGEQLEDTREYELTVTASPKDFIQNPSSPYLQAVGNKAIALSEDANYKVIVKSGALTIKKTIEGMENPDQTFVFEIKQYRDMQGTDLVRTFYETIRVSEGSNSKTILNLPKGYYQVVEKSDWSWQYEPVGSTTDSDTLGMNGDGSRNVNKVKAKADFTNASKPIKWLTSIDWVINLFTGGDN